MQDTYHFIGIGGIGMSGLAHLLLDQNLAVAGSDKQSNSLTEELAARGAGISIGHAAENVSPTSTVIYTTGIASNNPEWQAAKQLQLPILHRSDLLWQLAKQQKPLAVAGTHGKTTTSALLTMVLSDAGKEPSFAVGGILSQLGTNARRGRGEHFVFEACESDGTFEKYTPFAAILTNIDCDHVDYFQSEAALHNSFLQFISGVQHLFWCGDDAALQKISPKGISYGFSAHCDVRITHFYQQGWRIFFDIELQSNKFHSHEFYGKKYQKIELSLQGKHSCLNAAAVFALALLLGIDEDAIRASFAKFEGVLRRLEKKGDVGGVLFLDDYGHHPTEIKTTLQGIRAAIGERRLIVLYQPHRYSRTEYCQDMYHSAFDAADMLFLTDIYSAGECPIKGINAAALLEKIASSSAIFAQYSAQSELAVRLLPILSVHDVVVTLGAGNIVFTGQELLTKWQSTSKKLKVALIFGGASVEHEVSILSAQNVAAALRQDIYEIVYFGISKTGNWICGTPAKACLAAKAIAAAAPLDGAVLASLLECDVMLPILHGSFGEDGTIQGFFEILGKPYAGCDHRSAAICMDKAVTKQLMIHHNIPTLPFYICHRKAWVTSCQEMHLKIIAAVGLPLFIKPVHLGSSVGVCRVSTVSELEAALKCAFKVDYCLIAEKALIARELEFAVLGNENACVFPPGEVLTEGQVYDYAAKYGHKQTPVTPKAHLLPSILAKGQEIAQKAYQAAGCCGMARVDVFLDKDDNFWLNEINPIPGFTNNSLYPLICKANGLPLASLLDQLIILALEKKRSFLAC